MPCHGKIYSKEIKGLKDLCSNCQLVQIKKCCFINTAFVNISNFSNTRTISHILEPFYVSGTANMNNLTVLIENTTDNINESNVLHYPYEFMELSTIASSVPLDELIESIDKNTNTETCFVEDPIIIEQPRLLESPILTSEQYNTSPLKRKRKSKIPETMKIYQKLLKRNCLPGTITYAQFLEGRKEQKKSLGENEGYIFINLLIINKYF